LIQSTIEVSNQLGLHARAAAKLVKLTQTFKCEILIERLGREVDAKSIMGVMMLAASFGTSVRVTATGPDEHDAIEAVKTLFLDKFYEPK
jgi:phosphocarrier protein HPr